MSPSKEFFIHKWKTARHIFAASLLGVSATAAGGTEASSSLDRILQEVPTPVIDSEVLQPTSEEEEQEQQSGIQATIPPTPVVLVMPTPEASVELNSDSRQILANIRQFQLGIVENLPEFNEQRYRAFTYNGEQVPFGMIEANDVNMGLPQAEEWGLSTHVAAVVDIRSESFPIPGSSRYTRYWFVTLQAENMTFVASYFITDISGGVRLPNVMTTTDGNLSRRSSLAINSPSASLSTPLEGVAPNGIIARYEQAMHNDEPVVVQFWNRPLTSEELATMPPLGRAQDQILTTGNRQLIEVIESGSDITGAGVITPSTVVFFG